MMGWAMDCNRVTGTATPLFARAMVLEDARGGRAVLATVELQSVDLWMWQQIVERLRVRDPRSGWGPHNVQVSAIHTHSAPCGYSPYLLYNLSNPGFSEPLFEKAVEGTVGAILEAAARLEPAELSLDEATIPRSEPVAFQRSLDAYLRNRDVTRLDASQADLALDRSMLVLRVRRPDGRPLGAMNWFGLHNTSVHADQTLLHHDNKGRAALFHEEAARGDSPGFVSLFAQESAGDVTPNFRFSRERNRVIGRYDDDAASADYVGRVQHEAVERGSERPGVPIAGAIDGVVRRVDLSSVWVAPRFAGGRRDARTGPPRYGLAMAQGTAEGPAPMMAARPLTVALNHAARLRHTTRRALRLHDSHRDEVYGAQFPFLDLDGRHGEGGGTFGGRLPFSPGWLPPVDTTLRWARRLRREGALEGMPWIPSVLPVQVIRIGPLAIASLPLEPTTVSGRRIRGELLATLRQHGVERVVCAGYANGYAGYVTTPEEFDVQNYEGASTCFGRETLGAVQTILDRCATALAQPAGARQVEAGPALWHFSPALLRAHASPHARR